MLNHVTMMGRLTRDPELRSTGGGISVTTFSLACERDIPSADGKRETDFIDVVAWRKTAEFVTKYFRKGSMMAVSGRLQSRRWEDKEGQKRSTVEIVADNVYFAERKSDGGQQQSSTVDFGTPPPERRSYGAQSPAPQQPSYDFQDAGSFSELDDDGEVPF